MSLKDLNIEQMIAHSTSWTTPGSAAHGVLMKIVMAQAFLSVVSARRETLLKLPTDGRKKSLALLAGQAASFDQTHDGLARGVHGIVVGLGALAAVANPAYQAQVVAVEKLLFPDGLGGVTQASYLAEAGAAERIRALLTPEHWALLASIQLPAEIAPNLGEVVERWLKAAHNLGEVEHERQALQAQQSVDVSPSEIRAAANAWISETKTLRGILKAAKVSPDDWATVFAALERDAQISSAR